MKKLCAAVLLGLIAVSGLAGAEESAVSAAEETVTIRGEILGWEENNFCLISGEDGILRADLGKKGGRLLRHTPFTVTGTMESDEKGPYLKMEKVEYTDPDPLLEYASAGETASVNGEVQQETRSGGRDAAYFHGSVASDSTSHWADGNIEVDRTAYSECRAADILTMETGMKVCFLGRAIRTVVQDQIMLFWDAEGTAVKVVMNGAYIPLGQRGTIYGTVQKQDGENVLSLDLVESAQ